VIPQDPFNRTYADLDSWYRRRGTSLQNEARKLQIDQIKKTLIAGAVAGAPKPRNTVREVGLQQHLLRFTRQRDGMYDPVFDAEIRRLRPDWFASNGGVAALKQRLIELAREGAPRPSSTAKDPHEQQLGALLRLCTAASDATRDDDFNHLIRGMRPDWFVTIAATRKAELLRLAKSGVKLQDLPTKLRSALLYAYTRKTSKSFDAVFNAEIRRVCCHDWFRTSADDKREKLLEWARSGRARPSPTAKDPVERRLGCALKYYTRSPNAANVMFTHEIKAARPDWFRRDEGEDRELSKQRLLLGWR